ncbi:MAG: hypothetical protein ACXVZ1_09965 [Gaiellaceae bacterium]
MTRDERRPDADERAEMHMRIMVEHAVRAGRSEREIETLLKQVEGRRLLSSWPDLPRAA